MIHVPRRRPTSLYTMKMKPKPSSYELETHWMSKSKWVLGTHYDGYLFYGCFGYQWDKMLAMIHHVNDSQDEYNSGKIHE
jgi:hypothetical protein